MVLHLIFILSLFMCPASCNHMMVSNLQSIFTGIAVGQTSCNRNSTCMTTILKWFTNRIHTASLLVPRQSYCDSHSCLYTHHKWLESHICANMFGLIWWIKWWQKTFLYKVFWQLNTFETKRAECSYCCTAISKTVCILNTDKDAWLLVSSSTRCCDHRQRKQIIMWTRTSITYKTLYY